MNKATKIITGIFFLCLSLGVSAQTTHTIGVFCNPQLNVLDLKMQITNMPSLEKKTGISLSEGLFYQAKFNNLGFSVGLGYTKINNNYLFKGEPSHLIGRKEKSFLSIPVSFFYDFYQKGIFSIGANAGLSIDYLLKDEHTNPAYEILTSKPHTPKFGDRINLSAFAGIDFKWTFSNGIGIGITPNCSYIFTNTLTVERQMKSKNIIERYINIGMSAKFFYTF